MRRYYPILFLLVLSAACYHKVQEPVFNMAMIIPEDTMVSLLTDLQLIDGAVNLKARKGKSMSAYADAYSQQILEKYHVTREEFAESIRYYTFYIEKMDAIYEQVINNLGKLESEVNASKQVENEKVKMSVGQDSVNDQ